MLTPYCSATSLVVRYSLAVGGPVRPVAFQEGCNADRDGLDVVRV
jgi:hypothetical protein